MKGTVIAGIFGYVLVQFMIGAWVSRRMKTEQDYILAGRSLGTGLVAFSVFATWFGAEAIVSSAGEIYEKGISGALTDPFGYGFAVVAVALLIAAPLWKRGLVTYADLLRTRYSPTVEKAFVILLLPGSLFWAAAQIRSFGQIVGSSAGIDVSTAILVAAALVAAYSVVGGLLADAITDVVQGVAVIIGLVILAAFVAASIDPAHHVVALPGQSGAGTKLVAAGEDASAWNVVERLAVVLCGSIVSVELISRFLGASSATAARTGTLIGGGMYLIVGLLPVYLGLVGPLLIRDLAEPEQIVPRLAESYLPGYLYPLFIGAQISAILSVVHAALHAPAAQISHNVVAAMVPGLSAHARLTSVRLTVLALSIVALLLAQSVERIKDLVETASAFGSAGAFVVSMFAIFTEFGGARAALASLAAGIVVWAVGRYAFGLSLPYLIALGTSLAVYVGVGLLERRLSSPAVR